MAVRLTLIHTLPLVLVLAGLPTSAVADDDTSGMAASSAADTNFLSRHLRILQVEQATRFNYMDRGPGLVTDRDIQYRVRGRFQINLAGDGTTYLRFRTETGRGFDNSWDNTGLGKGNGRWNFNMKSFSIGQKLGSRLEVQAGGIEFDPGAGSEHTYASGDGHMVGYRALVTDTTHQWRPEKLSLTLGYVSDFQEPNIFSRFRMGKLNYMQALAQKKLGEKGEGSTEIDTIRGIWYARQAIRWQTPWPRVLDEAMVEAVTRATHNPSFAWSAALSRNVDAAGRWRAHAIYAHIPDRLYAKGGDRILLNQGEIDVGKRIALGAGWRPARNLEIGVWGGRLLDRTPSKRWIAQVSITTEYADLLNHLLH